MAPTNPRPVPAVKQKIRIALVIATIWVAVAGVGIATATRSGEEIPTFADARLGSIGMIEAQSGDLPSLRSAG